MPRPVEASEGEARVRAAFARQAQWCRTLGSPFTALLCETAADRLHRNTAPGRRILDWPGDPDARADSVPLRFAGALNGLVRVGAAPRLAQLYPPAPLPSPDGLWTEIERVLAERAPDLDAWLDSAPQTNEVARSAVLFAGLLQIASETERSLDLLEPGASAGLNLILDRYGYRFGSMDAGSRSSPLHLAPEWRGASPPDVPVGVAGRRGVDLAPIDIADPSAREKLLAYVWPDQRERVARLETALSIAEGCRPPLDKADAADWLEEQLARATPPDTTRVVMHSIAFQYFPAPVQERIRVAMMQAGEVASASSPLAWLQYEVDPELGGRTSLRLRLWPGGAERRLAIADPHARTVEWLL